jgi:hypothetical protein
MEGLEGALYCGVAWRGALYCGAVWRGALYCGAAWRGWLYSGAGLALPEACGMERGATYSVRP